jgi:hypothetical protein
MNSLSVHATHLIGLKIRDYRTPTGENSGLLLLFLVIQESTLKTKSTMNSLWGKLTAGLPSIMNANANNIMTFNTEIREIQQKLRAQGEDPSNIIPQLFAVYQGCEGEETAFFRFVEYLENDYNNGSVLTATDLMYKAEEKYKEIKERQRYTTGKDKPSDLVALQTKVEALTKHLKDKKSPGGSDKKKERERPALGLLGAMDVQETQWRRIKHEDSERERVPLVRRQRGPQSQVGSSPPERVQGQGPWYRWWIHRGRDKRFRWCERMVCRDAGPRLRGC